MRKASTRPLFGVAFLIGSVVIAGSRTASAQAAHDVSGAPVASAFSSSAISPLNVKYLPPDRPAALAPLYVSLVSLQVMDTAFTLRGLNQGAVEANPVVAGVTKSPAAFMALKGGLTVMSIYAAEGFRKRHPVASVVLLSAINSTYAAVVAHNYQVTRR